MARIWAVILALIFFASPAHALVIGQQSSFSIGGTTIVGKQMIMLSAQISANGGWSTFKNANSNASGATPAGGYTPSGSNIFCAVAGRMVNASATVWPDIQLGEGTVDMGWNQSSSSGTITYKGGAGPGFTKSMFLSPTTPGTITDTARDFNITGISFANGKYPFVYWVINTYGLYTHYPQLFIWGYEATSCAI